MKKTIARVIVYSILAIVVGIFVLMKKEDIEISKAQPPKQIAKVTIGVNIPPLLALGISTEKAKRIGATTVEQFANLLSKRMKVEWKKVGRDEYVVRGEGSSKLSEDKIILAILFKMTEHKAIVSIVEYDKEQLSVIQMYKTIEDIVTTW